MAEQRPNASSVVPDYQPPDPTPAETATAYIEGDLAALKANLADLSIDVPRFLDAADVDGVVQLLAELRAHAEVLGQITDDARRAVANRLGKGKHHVAGFQVEVKSGGGWSDWQHDKLAWRVLRDIAVDPDTGEVVAEVADIVDQVRSRLLNAAGIAYWRTGQLGPLGIDVSEFAQWKPAKRGVVLTKDVT